MDIDTTRLFRWDDVPLEAVTPNLERRIITGTRVMAARIRLRRGCVVPLHSHEAEQVSWVFSGALEFTFGRERVTVGPGEVLIIPSGLPHQAVALETTDELDVFSPIRHDWLNGTDAYFHAPPAAPSDQPAEPANGSAKATRLVWRDTAVERQTPFIQRSFVTGERTTIAQVALRAGAVVPVHSHESEQLTWVERGELELTVAGEVFSVRPGSVLRIPSGVPHDARARADTVVLDLFSPRRDDWIAKTDHYFRQGN